MWLWQVIMLLDFLNDTLMTWINMKIDNYVKTNRWKRKSALKLINRILGVCFFYIKFTRLSLENAFLYLSASIAIQQAFSKPCLVNLISRVTHLVFSIQQNTKTPFNMFYVVITFIICWCLLVLVYKFFVYGLEFGPKLPYSVYAMPLVILCY